MTTAHRRYVAIEATIGAAISGVLSAAFFVLIFGRSPRVPAFGAHGLAVDALPQSFMIALMASLVPTLLTRGRVRRGVQSGRQDMPLSLPRNVAVRSIMVAIAVTIVGEHATCLVLSMGAADFAFWSALVAKTIYGTLLGGIVAAVATRAALSDPHL